ncbi:hypothetical protein WR25_26233 [Diploscapter pachys]|uniref:Uncharacterized protein n=1 Tax=Diploscapter pachys TaxID=2018661 RepID=A0A2A2JSU2_9BILA|nr:hypothetical protein WR25_26233 [Diploscapter pachys]
MVYLLLGRSRMGQHHWVFVVWGVILHVIIPIDEATLGCCRAMVFDSRHNIRRVIKEDLENVLQLVDSSCDSSCLDNDFDLDMKSNTKVHLAWDLLLPKLRVVFGIVHIESNSSTILEFLHNITTILVPYNSIMFYSKS